MHSDFFWNFFLRYFFYFFHLIFPIELGHQTKKIEQGKRNRERWVFFFWIFYFLCVFFEFFYLVPQVFKLYGLFNQLESRHKKKDQEPGLLEWSVRVLIVYPRWLVHRSDQLGLILYTQADSSSLGWSAKLLPFPC